MNTKCLICDSDKKEEAIVVGPNEWICKDCAGAEQELTNGKGEDEE